MTMRKLLLIGASILVLAAAATALMVKRSGREWTTDSPAALAEFQQGLRDDLKAYFPEAAAHYARAAELDPDFLAAKVKLVEKRRMDREQISELIADLRGRDLGRVSPRERFLVLFLLAHVDRQPDRARALLADYVAAHPEDPFGLDLQCHSLWDQKQWPGAEACYRRLIATDPNWVQAQNNLGYLAMSQGHFAAAEEQFEIYRYIAPDQPNPHDSLGDLLLLTGRWREARQELEEALRIKPDFCASWRNRILLAVFEQDYDDADAVLARAEDAKGCPPEVLGNLRCRVKVWRAHDAGDLDGTLAAAQGADCGAQPGDVTVISYQAALRAGRLDAARAIEQRVVEREAKYSGEKGSVSPTELHLEGIRLRLSGHPAEAVAKLRAADEALNFWPDQAYLKLATRLQLSQALAEAGDAAAAAKVLAEVESVNAPLVERWRPRPVESGARAGAG